MRKAPLLASPRRNGGGTRGACDEQGGTTGFAGGHLHPRLMVSRHPLWPAGHLPHCVVENVREPRSHVDPDRGYSHHLKSRPHHELPPVDPTTNRGSRLTGGDTTPKSIMRHNRRRTSHRDIPAYPRGLPRMTSKKGSSRAAGDDGACRTVMTPPLPMPDR